MEHLVLDVLKFECSPPTAHFFANHFSKMSGLAGNLDLQYRLGKGQVLFYLS